MQANTVFFYPELNLYVGFGSLLHTKSETGCEEDKELITNTCNCFDMLHSEGNGFAETRPDSCITSFSANIQLI